MQGDGHELSLVFGDVAEAYEIGRPEVPLQVAVVLSHMGIVPGKQVLELAAGTGKLTRLLVAMGVNVLASEPSLGMRTVFETVLPKVKVLANTSSSMPGNESEWDFVIAADAFHWFDAVATKSELIRVLKPGGRVINIESARVLSEGYSSKLDAIITRYRGVEPDSVSSLHGQWKKIVDNDDFDKQDLYQIRTEELFEPAVLLAFVESMHYVASLDDKRKQEILAATSLLTQDELAKGGGGVVRLPFVISVASAQKS